MPLFFVSPENIKEDEKTFLIQGEDSKHIVKSLRYKENDKILITDGKGNKYLAKIDCIENNLITGKIVNAISASIDPIATRITMAQALVKSHKMDFIIQKSTELGIYSIIPFISSRTIPIICENNLWKKHQRWEKIAYEACKQSERSVIPKIFPIINFSELLNKSMNFNLSLIFWENETTNNLKYVLSKSKPKTILCIIGPEGGFSQEEIRKAQEFGLISTSLGNHYLKSETAALFVLSIVNYLYNF